MLLDPLVMLGAFGLFVLGLFAIDALRAQARTMTFVLGLLAMMLAVEVMLAAEARMPVGLEAAIPAEAMGGF